MRYEAWFGLVTGIYFLGVFLTWSYGIAYALKVDSDLVAPAIFFGWLPSLFWPFILMVQGWLLWWF